MKLKHPLGEPMTLSNMEQESTNGDGSRKGNR
jgi:hypothetical protein